MTKKPKKDDSQDSIDMDIEQLEQHIEEVTGDLKRVQADFINYRKRAEDDKVHTLNTGKRVVIENFLPVLDNIERALAHVPADLKDNSWAKGVTQVAKQAEAALKDMGVVKIEAAGEPFDPNIHEAVSFEDGKGEEIVSEVIQPGYLMGDDVIRPAMVRVSKKQVGKSNKEEK